MRHDLGLRLMRAHPSAPWAGPHTAPLRGDEKLPAREHETGILWVYYGPIPATPRSLSTQPWGWCPDLDDDATIGVLLASARRAWDAPRLACHWFAGDDGPYTAPGWIVDLGDGENVVAGATDYVEALLLAIEAAPNREVTTAGPAVLRHPIARVTVEIELRSFDGDLRSHALPPDLTDEALIDAAKRLVVYEPGALVTTTLWREPRNMDTDSVEDVGGGIRIVDAWVLR